MRSVSKSAAIARGVASTSLALGALAACYGDETGSPGSLALSSYAGAGCANVTQTFLKTYAGTFVDSPDVGIQTTSVTIAASGAFDVQEVRQVGGTSGVPYPTTCSYFNRGKVLGVFDVSSSKSCQALVPADSGATSILVYQVTQLSVNDAYPSANPSSGPGCQAFQSALASQAASGNLSYTVDLALMGNAAFRFEDGGSGPMAGELLTRSQ